MNSLYEYDQLAMGPVGFNVPAVRRQISYRHRHCLLADAMLAFCIFVAFMLVRVGRQNREQSMSMPVNS